VWLGDILACRCGIDAFCAAAGTVKDAVPASSATAIAQAAVFIVIVQGPLVTPRRRASHRTETQDWSKLTTIENESCSGRSFHRRDSDAITSHHPGGDLF
jgi:hypothetical protein